MDYKQWITIGCYYSSLSCESCSNIHFLCIIIIRFKIFCVVVLHCFIVYLVLLVPPILQGDNFQEDIYPPTASTIPSLRADEWIAGQNREPILVSLMVCVTPMLAVNKLLKDMLVLWTCSTLVSSVPTYYCL